MTPPDAMHESAHAARVRAAIGQETQLFLEYFHPLGARAHHALSTYLQYRATNRDIFARGALHAAARLHGRAPGRYRVADLL